MALLTGVLLLCSAAVAQAQPPNDTFAGATPVAIGFSEVLDTTEATTDDDDAQLNTSCGAPATDASVWYALDGSDTGVVVDVSQSSYSAGVLVGVGSQSNLQTVTCGRGPWPSSRKRGPHTTCWPSTTSSTGAATAGP